MSSFSLDKARASLAYADPPLFEALCGEEERQADGIELIPSENYTYPQVQALLGSAFTNKYSEGYPGRRYYGGQYFTDRVEALAIERACALFRAEHANVQPLSGSPMNQAVYLGLLSPGDRILAMDLSHGGHLTHGAPVSHMGRLFQFERYKTDPATGTINFDALAETAKRFRPKLLLCGHSSYPRELDYARFRAIAEDVGALTMADVSHIGGLIATNVLANPLDCDFDVMTTTTHKSLRGPRGGVILCKRAFAKKIDTSVFPGLQGGPHMNQVAATAFTLSQAAHNDFRDYAQAVLANAQALGEALTQKGVHLITGGTDNHLIVVDTVASFGIDGHKAQEALDRIGLTVNKQVIPDDPLPAFRPSGIRLGTPAATTRGMDPAAMRTIAGLIVDLLKAPENVSMARDLAETAQRLANRFPLPQV